MKFNIRSFNQRSLDADVARVIFASVIILATKEIFEVVWDGIYDPLQGVRFE